MAGHTKWKGLRGEVADKVGEDRLLESLAKAKAEQDAGEVTLRQVREAMQLTQVQLAAELEVTQAEVSRIEHRSDLLLSTLSNYVHAMGGELDLVARFGATSMPLTIGELIDEKQPVTKPRKRSAA